MANTQMRRSLRNAILLAAAMLALAAVFAGTYRVNGDRIAGGFSGQVPGGESYQDLFGASGGAEGSARGGVIGTTGQALIGGPFKLVTSQGDAFSEQDLKGAPSVIVFGLMDRDGLAPPAFNAIEKSLREIGPAARDVRIVFVALEGRPDDLQSLQAFARDYPTVTIAATGDSEALLQIAKTFKFYLRKAPQPGAAAAVSYAPFLFIMDDEGRYSSHARLPTNARTLKPLIQAALD